VVLLGFAGDGMIERRVRLGRHGRAIVLTRFRELPGGTFGRALERVGARELPLLLAVLRGRLSFVGPRALPPGTGAGHTGPRRLLAPGLTGPAQRHCTEADDPEALRLDDAYVANWTLWADARLLAGRGPKPAHQSVSKSSS
jgi:sugar transferase